jgi:hypothetical protein
MLTVGSARHPDLRLERRGGGDLDENFARPRLRVRQVDEFQRRRILLQTGQSFQ